MPRKAKPEGEEPMDCLWTITRANRTLVFTETRETKVPAVGERCVVHDIPCLITQAITPALTPTV